VKIPIFFAKVGRWGEEGWKKVSLFIYMWLWLTGYVTKVRWMKCSLKK